MPFQNQGEVCRYIGGIFEVAFRDAEIGPKLTNTQVILRFVCTDPDTVLIIDTVAQRVHLGEQAGLEPSASLHMAASVANEYWQGKVNLPFAMAKGTIAVGGNITSLLKLAPLSKKLYPVYIGALQADGRSDLLA